MSFRFRLQSVLKLRLAARDERRKALADALRAESIVREQIETLKREMEESRESARAAASPGRVEVDRLLSLNRHELLLGANIKSLEMQRLKIAEELERRRLALVEADRDVKALEKLRERQEREAALAEDRREQQQLDELAIVRAFAQQESRT